MGGGGGCRAVAGRRANGILGNYELRKFLDLRKICKLFMQPFNILKLKSSTYMYVFTYTGCPTAIYPYGYRRYYYSVIEKCLY